MIDSSDWGLCLSMNEKVGETHEKLGDKFSLNVKEVFYRFLGIQWI